MISDSSGRRLLKLLGKGWIAGYPPWRIEFWIKPARCETKEQISHLLHFLRSIEDGNPDETRRLLPGINLNLRLTVVDIQTESLLEWAAEKARHADCIRILVEAGASLQAPNLVLKLVHTGRTELLAELLRSGAEPNAEPGCEAGLIEACWRQPKMVGILLEAGANTDVTTTVYIANRKQAGRVTPLMVAAYAGQIQTVNLLLKAGAKVNAVDDTGGTALTWARISRAKAKAAKIISLLETAGAKDGSQQGKLPEPIDFRIRAKSPEFQKALELARLLTKSAGKPVPLAEGPLPGARAFKIQKGDTARDLLNEILPETLKLGALAFLTEGIYEIGVPYLVLLPTVDYREAIRAFETPEGQSINSNDLIDWLAELETRQPFVLTHLASDSLRGKFTTAIGDSAAIIRGIQRICPEAENSPIEDMARQLEQSHELFLWWD